jgi:hypothetical protein
MAINFLPDFTELKALDLASILRTKQAASSGLGLDIRIQIVQ